VIYLLHGDPFLVRRALDEVRSRLQTPDGMLESNTVVLDGAKLTPLELIQHATTVPFLASARLVIVEGLLQHLGGLKAPRGKKKDGDPLEEWREAARQLGEDGAVPDTNTLVFLDPQAGARSGPFSLFAAVAQVNHYEPVKDKDLGAWIRDEAASRGLNLSPGAIRALVQSVGADLWALHNELTKLETLAAGSPIDEAMVRESVVQAREMRVWDLSDAVVAGEESKAMQALSRLLVEGEPPPLLSSMVARQYRQLAVTKDLTAARATEGDIARAAGIPEWKVRDTSTLAARYSWPDLRRAYALLVDADLSVKRGLQDDESALQLLVHDLCALAPRATAQRARH